MGIPLLKCQLMSLVKWHMVKYKYYPIIFSDNLTKQIIKIVGNHQILFLLILLKGMDIISNIA